VAELSPNSPLNGYDQTIGDMRLREVTDLDIVALAIPIKGTAKLKRAINNGFGMKMPTPTLSVVNNTARLMITQPDQLFALQPRSPHAENAIAKVIGDTAYITDQTDAWVVLELDGPSSRSALERVCQLDLDDNQFTINQMARTTMEHMVSTIVRTGEDQFLLMSPSSSARSFLHAIELSAKHVS